MIKIIKIIMLLFSNIALAQIAPPVLSPPVLLTSNTIEQSNADLTTINIPLPAFGNLIKNGTALTLPIYNKRISRCTDVNTANISKLHSYEVTYSGGMSERQFNHDHTLLAVTVTGTGTSIVLNFDSNTMQCSSMIPASQITGSYVWDLNNSNTLYQLQDTVVNKWVFGSQITTIKYFDFEIVCNGLPPAGTNLTWLGSLQVSSDGKFVTGFSFKSDNQGSGQDTGQWIAVYNPALNQCQLINTMTGIVSGIPSGQLTGTWYPFTLHDTAVSKSGYIEAAVGNICNDCPTQHGPFIIQSGTLDIQFITKQVGGHNSMGISNYINLSNAPATMKHNYVDVNNQIVQLTSAKNVTYPPHQETHLSWTDTIDDRQPLFFSQILLPCQITGPLECELFAAKTDGSDTGYFLRLAPTFSSGLSNNFRTQNAICSVSDDGGYAACASDGLNTFGNIDGITSTCTPGTDCRSDVIVIETGLN